MLRNQAFWIGILVGLAAFYFYTNHFKGGKGKGSNG